MSALTVKEASIQEMNFLLSHAKEEGWNPGLHDATPFYRTDPHGFFIGFLGDEKIGCLSAVAYDTSFGFMGFYIVAPKHRGKGFGHQLWSHGLGYLGNRCIGLDGVLQQQKSYEESNFKLSYKNQRFKRRGEMLSPCSGLQPLSDVPFASLLEYDSLIFGLQREAFLKEWAAMPESHAVAKVEKGYLKGYGVMRKCFEGYKIGPLFANSLDIARDIFQTLCAYAKVGPIFLDIPSINTEAMLLVEAFQLKPIFATVRMYNKSPPKQELKKIFGVTTFELG